MTNVIDCCDWEITTGCNLRCRHCLIKDNTPNELSTKACLKVADMLRSLGCRMINFTGGEALTRKDFFKIAAYCKSKGFINTLFTNACLIDAGNIKLIKELFGYVAVSLEGDKAAHEYIRGKGTWDKTMAAIKLFRKNKIPFGIYITINKLNIDNLEDSLHEIKKLGAANISINELVPRGRSKDNVDVLQVKIDTEEVLKTIKDVFPDEKFEIEAGCSINPKNIFLTSDGKFYPCTEIMQCFGKEAGSLLPIDTDGFTKFAGSLKSRSLPQKCPYISYVSKKLTLNFLTGEKCPFVK